MRSWTSCSNEARRRHDQHPHPDGAAGHQTISFTREFEAPAARVFDAHVDPDLVAQWIGPRGTRLGMRHYDARSGGSWSYVVAGLDGEWAFHGSFHEVTTPTRIVHTFEYEGDPGLGHSTITLTMDTYSHVLPALQREAADSMDALIG